MLTKAALKLGATRKDEPDTMHPEAEAEGRPAADASLREEPDAATEMPQEQAEAERAASAQGTRALMFAVLEEAIVCLRRGASHPNAAIRFQAAQAIRWVQSSDEKWVFSFENVCQALNLEADRLRIALLRMVPKENSVETQRHRLSHRVDRPRRPLRAKKT